MSKSRRWRNLLLMIDCLSDKKLINENQRIYKRVREINPNKTS